MTSGLKEIKIVVGYGVSLLGIMVKLLFITHLLIVNNYEEITNYISNLNSISFV